VLSLTVGGGLLARELYRRPDQAPAVPATLPASNPLRPSDQPGPRTVELTADAAAHPQHEQVRALLQSYFDAINNRDYVQWTSSVSAERRQNKTRNEWAGEYKSTQDGSILVYRIETVGQAQLRALVAFTSTQDIGEAPVGLPETCIHWRLTLPVVLQDGRWRVDAVAPGTTPEREKC
jgi:hypothetical protein